MLRLKKEDKNMIIENIKEYFKRVMLDKKDDTDYSKILIKDIEKKIGTFDCFAFVNAKEIENLIKINYKNFNSRTLYNTTARIIIEYLDHSFCKYKEIEKRTDMLELINNENVEN